MTGLETPKPKFSMSWSKLGTPLLFDTKRHLTPQKRCNNTQSKDKRQKGTLRVVSTTPFEKPTGFDDALVSGSKIPANDLTVLRAANDPAGIKLQFEDAMRPAGRALRVMCDCRLGLCRLMLLVMVLMVGLNVIVM
jgi:hypothetical protein